MMHLVHGKDDGKGKNARRQYADLGPCYSRLVRPKDDEQEWPNEGAGLSISRSGAPPCRVAPHPPLHLLFAAAVIPQKPECCVPLVGRNRMHG